MAEKPYKLTGDRVKEAIKGEGISQVDLADRLDYSTNYINQIVQGNRPLTVEIAKRVASLTGVRYEYLLGYDDYKTEDDRIDGLLQSQFFLTKGYQAFLSYLSRRVGASIQYVPPVQDPDSLLTVEDLRPGYYTFTDGSESGTIPEAEMARATDEVIAFAEFKLQRLIKQYTKQDDTGSSRMEGHNDGVSKT